MLILPAVEVQSPGFSTARHTAPNLMVDLAGYRDFDGSRTWVQFPRRTLCEKRRAAERTTILIRTNEPLEDRRS